MVLSLLTNENVRRIKLHHWNHTTENEVSCHLSCHIVSANLIQS